MDLLFKHPNMEAVKKRQDIKLFQSWGKVLATYGFNKIH